jgi:SAM-dependent methyltransferase
MTRSGNIVPWHFLHFRMVAPQSAARRAPIGSVNFGRQNKITFGQAIDLMRPDFDGAGTPPDMQVGMVRLFLGNVPDLIRKSQSRREPLEGKRPFQALVFMGGAPAILQLPEHFPHLSRVKGRNSSPARNARFFRKTHGFLENLIIREAVCLCQVMVYSPSVGKVLAAYPIKTFEDFRVVAQLYQYSRVIATAQELDLFTVVGNQALSVPVLAKRLQASPRGLDILCRNLAALGLLVKRGTVYRNSSVAKRDLNRNSPGYRAEYLKLIQSHWKDFAKLTRSVRLGTPAEAGAPDSPHWRREFTWAMHYRSREQANRIAGRLDFRGAETLLDLGGGPGTYAMAFLQKHRALRATIADRPAALKVAREIAARHPANARLAFVPLDFMQDSLPRPYDIIWLSNIIHIYSPAENLILFRKAARALAPGGRLLIHDSFITDPLGLYPIETTAFALTMLLFTETGNTYPSQEVMRWLQRTGYMDVKQRMLVSGHGRRTRLGESGVGGCNRGRTSSAENGIIEGRLPRR